MCNPAAVRAERVPHRSAPERALVIDEAQHLSVPALEAVRLLSNFETNSRKLMQILLVGQPEPRDKLNQVRMFTGAMMSFRRDALGGIRHDARYRGASVGEDLDLCWALGRRGGRLAIATDARIVHNRAPRPALRPRRR